MEQRKREPVFVAGDPRANQDVLLLVLHHIYVLEHNRLCDELKRHYPSGLSEGPWNDENLFLAARTILAGKNNMVASAYFGAYFTDYLEKGGDPLVIFRSYMGKGPLQINPFKVYPWKDVLNPENNAPFALPVDFSVGYRWHDLLVKEKKECCIFVLMCFLSAGKDSHSGLGEPNNWNGRCREDFFFDENI